jgi:hypothetical protein
MYMPFVNDSVPLQQKEVSISPAEHGEGATVIIERGNPTWNHDVEVIRFRVKRAGGMAPELSARDWLKVFNEAILAGILRE